MTGPDDELGPDLGPDRPRPRAEPRADRRPGRRPGAGLGGARDRAAHRRGRLGPAGPALRAGRHRGAGRARARAGRRDGAGRRRRGRVPDPGRAGPAHAGPAAGGGAGLDHLAPRRRRLRRGGGAAGAASGRGRRDPRGRGGGRGVRPRAPGPPGGAHRGRCDPRRVDVLRAAAAGPRRRRVGGRRRRPGARPAGAAAWPRWPTTRRHGDERAVRRRPARHAAAAADPAGPVPRAGDHRGGGGPRVLRPHHVRRLVHRPALVPLGRVRRRLHEAVLDPHRAVPLLRRPDGGRGRRQHGAGLPDAADVPAELAGADRPGPLPRGGHPDPDLAAGRRLGGRRPLRGVLGGGAVAPLPALAPRRAVRQQGPLLPQGHRLLRLRPAVAALPGQLRDGRDRGRAARGRRGPLPVRRDPAADLPRPAVGRGAGPALAAARRVRAGQGGRLLPRPVRPGHRWRRADHRHDLHRRPGGAGRPRTS